MRAFSEELRERLPQRLQHAHANGFADYFTTAKNAATGAAARRKLRSERVVGRLPPHVPGEEALRDDGRRRAPGLRPSPWERRT